MRASSTVGSYTGVSVFEAVTAVNSNGLSVRDFVVGNATGSFKTSTSKLSW
jgi:hypothetical protein